MGAKRRRKDGTFSRTGEVASATECTGLMPALPQDEAQDENEAELYGVLSAKDTGAKK